MAVMLREELSGARMTADEATINEDNANLIVRRARLLAKSDRDLLEAVLLRGQTISSMARLMGHNARTLTSRVAILKRRLLSRKFVRSAQALPYLDRAQARLARLHFCQRMPVREIARKTNMSYYRLRRTLESIGIQISMIATVHYRVEKLHTSKTRLARAVVVYEALGDKSDPIPAQAPRDS